MKLVMGRRCGRWTWILVRQQVKTGGLRGSLPSWGQAGEEILCAGVLHAGVSMPGGARVDERKGSDRKSARRSGWGRSRRWRLKSQTC